MIGPQPFVLQFPLYFVAVTEGESLAPRMADRPEDKALAVCLFTEELHAERDCASWREDAEIYDIRNKAEFVSSAVNFAKYLKATHVAIDPVEGGGAHWISIDECIHGGRPTA